MSKKKTTAARVQPRDIPVVILAGGRGTRLMEETQLIPKPMVTIGGKPVLFHIMKYYAAYGFRKFVICLGYKGHIIKDYFLNLHKHTASVVVEGSSGRHRYNQHEVFDWDICLVETGEHSLTGTRLYKVRSYLTAPHFCLTYGDGLSDVPLDRELEFHLRHGCLGTMAAVHPPSRFGKLEITGETQVQAFREKEHLNHDYINGGYMMFRRAFLDRLPAHENLSLESRPLTELAEDGELQAFKHEGYWMCMDTLRDRETIEATFDAGNAPWVKG